MSDVMPFILTTSLSLTLAFPALLLLLRRWKRSPERSHRFLLAVAILVTSAPLVSWNLEGKWSGGSNAAAGIEKGLAKIDEEEPTGDTARCQSATSVDATVGTVTAASALPESMGKDLEQGTPNRTRSTCWDRYSQWQDPIAQLLAWPYFFGLALALLVLLRQVLAASAIVRRAASIEDQEILGLLRQVRRGDQPKLRLAFSSEVSGPACFGGRTPVVLLPRDPMFRESSLLRAALAHEVAHVERHDPTHQLLQHVFRAIFWFHPVAWWMDRRLSELSELATDRIASERVGCRSYAAALITIAGTRFSVNSSESSPALLSWIRSRSSLRTRVEMLIADPSAPSKPSLVTSAVALLLVVVLASPVALAGKFPRIAESPQEFRVSTGLELKPAGDALAAQLGAPSNALAVVIAVAPLSPAAAAGLQQHDVVSALDGAPLDDLARTKLNGLVVPGVYNLTVRRAGKTLTIVMPVSVQSRPQPTDVVETASESPSAKLWQRTKRDDPSDEQLSAPILPPTDAEVSLRVYDVRDLLTPPRIYRLMNELLGLEGNESATISRRGASGPLSIVAPASFHRRVMAKLRSHGFTGEALDDTETKLYGGPTLTIEFSGLSLSDAMLSLQQASQIRIVVDKKARRIVGDRQLHLLFISTPLRIILQRIAANQGCEVIESEGAYYLRMKSEDDRRSVVRIYDVRDLFESPSAEELATLLQDAAPPSGTRIAFQKDLLIIYASAADHDRIEKKLDSLRRLSTPSKSVPLKDLKGPTPNLLLRVSPPVGTRTVTFEIYGSNEDLALRSVHPCLPGHGKQLTFAHVLDLTGPCRIDARFLDETKAQIGEVHSVAFEAATGTTTRLEIPSKAEAGK